MRIGIDGRLIEETGVGRYIRNLTRELGQLDKTNEYVVFLRKKTFDIFVLPHARWHKVLADIPWHSLREQLVMPSIFLKETLDLLHVPYFNVPIFYPGKLIVTIHDLTILHFDTGKATTLPWILYKLRRFGYRLVLSIGLRRAQKILAVSQTTKRDIVESFGIPADKIVVTHEGVEKGIPSKKRLIKDSYFLYVGNAYPHKNLEMLLEAFKKLSSKQKLVLVGSDDFFYKRLGDMVENFGLNKSVIFFGPGDDADLAHLYTYATALVFPSLMEGFGLPGIEAMAIGVPVVCSNIPVFNEIYGDACLTFNPKDPDDIAQKLREILENDVLRRDLIAKGKKQASKYSWRQMAQQTLRTYENSARL